MNNEQIKIIFGKVVKPRLTDEDYYAAALDNTTPEQEWTISVSIECDDETLKLGQLSKFVGGNVGMPSYEFEVEFDQEVDQAFEDAMMEIHQNNYWNSAAKSKQELTQDLRPIIDRFANDDDHESSPEPDVICQKCGGVKIGCEA